MTKTMRLLFFIGILILIAGINALSQDTSSVMGPDYPGLIRYNNNGIEAQLTVLGRDYQLSPEAVQVMERIDTWRVYLENFLESVEEIVEKYGRHAQEMMRSLRDNTGDVPL